MANIITAGNSTNGGTSVSTDTSGILNIVTGSGSGTTAVTVDGSQNVTINGSISVISASSALGYGTGSGGAITQTTNKQTAVTLNKPTGQIITSNSALAAGITTGFQFNNSLIAATDVVVFSINTPNTGVYQPWVYFTTSGYCFVAIKNNSGGSLSEAITLNFAIIKSVTA